MKAFFVGMVFILAAGLLGLVSFWMFPFILALAIILRILAFFVLIVFFIWLLGKFIIFVWESVREKP